MQIDTTRENPQAAAPQAAESAQDLAATAPGQLRVIKRNGTVVPYTDDKITVAITKAFLAVEGGTAAASSRIHETVARLTEQVTATFKRRMPSGGTIHIEEIQDQVELALMRAGEQKVARDYVIYREARANERKTASAAGEVAQPHPSIRITKADGSTQPLDMGRLQTIIREACEGLAEVDGGLIERETLKNLYDGVAEKDVNTALVMTARTLVEREPNYSYVTARLLMDTLRAEALGFLGVVESATHHEMAELYARALPAYIEKGVEFELVDPKLKTFDLAKLGAALNHERDQQFTYLGLQTLYDRYFIHKDGIRFELPQVFFMRVAMGLAIEEPQKEERAIEFYNLLSSFDYMSSTPTLFNAGTLRPQLSSCYLTTVPDDLSGIYSAIHDNAMLSKFAGGLGNDWTPVRALGSYIKGTNGKSQGVVPFLKVVNDTAVAVNQGGKRKGAVCAYLETWHLDIEEFLELRKNTGDDRRRTHDMNTANWIPDLFMKRVFEDGTWTLFSPSDVPDLHDLYGKAFEERYEYYEALTQYGKLKLHKVVQAKDLWRKMLSMLFETGHPWLTFKDPCNLRSPQQHVGVVHSSNLCTEITLNTNKDEIAVCNLGSVNLVNHIVDGKLDVEKLGRTVKTAVRMLDNVIDINYYSVPQAENSNLKHRPVGLGIMGFQDALYLQHIAYGSDAAIDFADKSMEAISYFAIQASCDLAEERGAYETFDGSLWSQGILPIDSQKLLIEARGAKYIEVDQSESLDWAPVRERVRKGIRNSNIMAIAPTATIANITGVSQSIEPTYQNLYVKSNLSGEFTVINPYLVRDLKARGLWDPVMVNDLKYYDGSVQQIERIPQDLKDLYATAFEVETKWIVDAASRRQKWIDQAQSLNLYIAGASGKKLDVTYRMAWYRGLKTTYYLRALAATSTEKSTINTGKLNAVSSVIDEGLQAAPAPAPVPKACSIDNPDCEACQ
ncbi:MULTISPECIES: ribonucleoside-diphosphate reductase subunit alpha [Pseudomonas]|jgi:ribonucleoside-diphosphate reductase alpha chain|uniref:Ribonucleoside-diphosphate reductase n=1 Tax=Pseudomonas citronellolis TaxID=53408 RepID=A0A127MWZ3_9PSED|nr:MULTISPECIES: ribonucleoside-diphosphate reductase subunit alpha [Pseudomonas]KSW22862.1 ribonucleotide-diphosphate reductase subunit alpha [Pseudomonas sp. ADP]AMO77601.1 Ribonucleoside-diphosphate reductase 1 subunit alpha [Pseudomonas citronellolis]ANI16359.1 ribonucleoside-diphosphate reductase subunit alpha [Pseudomonas citronellolis]KRV74596.1 ribonucleotide-diphosphate reductase subunit alpha [Pseudomonas citronellolis]KRW78603.1 ribonucleotide-diphosphate reductase subunit alpha [Ps